MRGLPWKDPHHRLQYAHGVLSLWGHPNTRVLVADLDEFLAPASAGATLPSMLATGCLSEPALRSAPCFYFQRRTILTSKGELPAMNEPALWGAAGGGHPLHQYRFATPPGKLPMQLHPKVLIDPNRVFPASAHHTTGCTAGRGDVANATAPPRLQSDCSVRQRCVRVPHTCASLFHAANMHRQRVSAVRWERLERRNGSMAPIQPADWLWMLSAERDR